MAKDDDEIARAQAAKRGTPFLNTEQAASYLGVSARKLQYMRSRCTGPRYRLHSRFVRYHIDDLIFWSRSTSPNAAKAGLGLGDAAPSEAGAAARGREEARKLAPSAARKDPDASDA